MVWVEMGRPVRHTLSRTPAVCITPTTHMPLLLPASAPHRTCRAARLSLVLGTAPTLRLLAAPPSTQPRWYLSPLSFPPCPPPPPTRAPTSISSPTASPLSTPPPTSSLHHPQQPHQPLPPLKPPPPSKLPQPPHATRQNLLCPSIWAEVVVVLLPPTPNICTPLPPPPQLPLTPTPHTRARPHTYAHTHAPTPTHTHTHTHTHSRLSTVHQ